MHFHIDLSTVCVCQQWQGQSRVLGTERPRQNFCPSTHLICRLVCLTGGECPWGDGWLAWDIKFWSTRQSARYLRLQRPRMQSADFACNLDSALWEVILVKIEDSRHAVFVGDYVAEEHGCMACCVPPSGEILCWVCWVDRTSPVSEGRVSHSCQAVVP